MAAGTFQRMDNVSNDLVNQSDSLGNMPSAYTNTTYSLIGNVTAAESDGISMFVIFITVIIFICIVIGGMVMLRQSGLGGNRYRT